MDQRRYAVAKAIKRHMTITPNDDEPLDIAYRCADAALAVIDAAETTDAEVLLKAADAVIESFHAYGQEKGSPLVIWRVDPIAMRRLIIAAQNVRKEPEN